MFLATVLALSSGFSVPIAAGSPTARLHVRFDPNRPGHSTNVSFAIRIGTRHQPIPPPLTGLDIRFPRELGFAISGLGLAVCTARIVEIDGPAGCPHNSWMGQGKAIAEVPFGPETLSEDADVSIFRAHDTGNNIAMLFDIEAWHPVITDIVLPGELRATTGSPYETIHVNVPLVETLPGAPDVSVVQLTASIGPRNLVYYELIHGHRVPYHPEGILLPNRCPTQGFRFAAILSFLDGSTTITETSVPCRHRTPRRPSAARQEVRGTSPA